MSALTPIFKILQTDPGVTQLTGRRAYPVELPQGSQLPALVITLVDERDGRHLLGTNRYPVARFVVDCIGESGTDGYWDADVLGEAVKAALIDYRGRQGNFQIDDIGPGDVDFFDKGPAGQHWRRRLAFLMRYRMVDAEPEDSPPA